MKKNTIILTGICLCLYSSQLSAVTSDISKIRTRAIEAIIKELVDAKEKLSDPFNQEAIFEKVNQKLPEPTEKPVETSIKDIAADVRVAVKKRFSETSEEVRKKAQKEAEKKYKLTKKLEKVTVTVRRGSHTYSVSGIFYRYGIGGKSVVIGDNSPIAFIDLVDADRAKFDKAFCEQVRKKYVKDVIDSYNKRKQGYLNRLFTERLNKVVSENEKRGYIYIWNKWRTPKNVTEYLIKQQIKLHPENELTDETSETIVTDDTPIITPEITPDDSSSEPVGEQGDSKQMKIAKLRQELEKRQMEIAGSQYGVDADQMFRKKDLLLITGMSREDLNLLTGLDGTGDSETLSYPTGRIDTVTFYFIRDLLYKIHIKYRIGPPEVMSLILGPIHDAYGESAEAKEEAKKEKERLARLKAIKHLCPKDAKGKDTHKWSKGRCKVCGVLKDDLYPPKVNKQHIVETWTGNIMKAVLEADLAQDESNFTALSLTKENFVLREEQEKILEEERLRKLEEDKRRTLEEFRKD